MKFLLSNIDQAPLDRILTYFKVQRRELRQSETCLFFVKSETEAGALTAEDIVRLRKEYYSKSDPDPCIDPETGEPYILTEDERLEWEIYMLKKQGNYAKANKLYNEKFGAAVAAEALPTKQQSKTGEVKDEELPF